MKLRPLTRWSTLAAILAVVILIGFALSRSRLAIASDGIPLAQVKHGNLDLKVHANGELNATHTMMLTAPAVGGGALQITRLLAGRLPVKKGDVGSSSIRANSATSWSRAARNYCRPSRRSPRQRQTLPCLRPRIKWRCSRPATM